MSRKIYCDRCGAVISDEYAYSVVSPDIKGVYLDDYIVEVMYRKVREVPETEKEDEIPYPFERVDLCRNCTIALVPMLNHFMNDKRSDVSEQS